MTSAITAQYSCVPRIQDIVSQKIIASGGVTNIIDSGFVSLANMRGKVTFSMTTTDAPTAEFGFNVVGGFGVYPDSPYRSWEINKAGLVNCTVIKSFDNNFVLTTVAPAIVRQYNVVFSPNATVAPKIRQTSVTLLGVEDITITMTKRRVVEGGY